MARKKLGKKSKAKKIGNRSQKATQTQVQKMEKEFNQSLTQLTAQCRKDLANVKQQESKIKNRFVKAENQHNQMNNKREVLILKTTAAAKKQLKALNKKLAKSEKLIKPILTELSQIQDQAHTLNDKVAKFSALNKHIATFNKEWSAKPTQATRSTRKLSKKEIATISATPSVEQIAPMEIEAHEMAFTETTELNS